MLLLVWYSEPAWRCFPFGALHGGCGFDVRWGRWWCLALALGFGGGRRRWRGGWLGGCGAARLRPALGSGAGCGCHRRPSRGVCARSQDTQQRIYFCATAAVLDLTYHRYRGTGQHRVQHGDARELGHSYLRLGLGLGLFLPAHFLQQQCDNAVLRPSKGRT
jgi:hypothetical protein